MFGKTGKKALWCGLISFLLLSVLIACEAPVPTGTTTQQAEPTQPGAPTQQAEPTQQATGAPEGSQAQGSGEGVQASFRYDPSLAENVQVQAVEAVPRTQSAPYWEAHPAYLDFEFVNYTGGAAAQRPEALATAKIFFYRTEYFSSLGNEPSSFSGQMQVLSDLLSEQPDLAQVVVDRSMPTQGGQLILPFLPLSNGIEAFCARPHYVKFQGGSGIAYLTVFAQGFSRITDPTVMYTFQGLTDDGSIYISAVFPIATGVFPVEAMTLPGQVDPNFTVDMYKTQVAEGVTALNAQAPDKFQPSLDVLDSLLASIVATK